MHTPRIEREDTVAYLLTCLMRMAREHYVILLAINQGIGDLLHGAVVTGNLQCIEFQHAKLSPEISADLLEVAHDAGEIAVVVPRNAYDLETVQSADRRPGTIISQMNDWGCAAFPEKTLGFLDILEVFVRV